MPFRNDRIREFRNSENDFRKLDMRFTNPQRRAGDFDHRGVLTYCATCCVRSLRALVRRTRGPFASFRNIPCKTMARFIAVCQHNRLISFRCGASYGRQSNQGLAFGDRAECLSRTNIRTKIFKASAQLKRLRLSLTFGGSKSNSLRTSPSAETKDFLQASETRSGTGRANQLGSCPTLPT